VIEGFRGPASWGRLELFFLSFPRMMAVPLFAGFVLAEGDEFDTYVVLVIIGAALYTTATLLIALSDQWDRFDQRWLIIPDLIVINVALAANGGPSSPVAVVLFVWTLAMSMIYSPRMVVILAITAYFSYLVMSAPFVVDGPGLDEDALRAVAVFTLSQLWITVVTWTTATSFARRERRISSLSEARGRLLADALSAEDRARRKLSQSLHDDALQTLLAAGQDLDAGIAAKDPGQLERARSEMREAVTALRETIRGLHPAALAHGGLSGGLDVVAERAARVGGFEVDLRVDPEASGPHDSLLVSVVRELATNAAKHSGADLLRVEVIRDGRRIRATVADDGRGMTPANREDALRSGHIGLASCAERIEAAGGTMNVNSGLDSGTEITIELPQRAADATVSG
jgi:two-component system, NarL family, sensor kinase